MSTNTVPIATDAKGQESTTKLVFEGWEISKVAEARLPTAHGIFRIVAFTNTFDHREHIAIVHGDVDGQTDLWTRLHSECLTGDVFSSLKCDCGQQLEAALAHLGQHECGAILYLRQEGRGIGLANKVMAYQLQDHGLDTVEANHHLGFDDDLRDYRVAAAMLRLLGVQGVRLMTNNPKKIQGLQEHSVEVTGREPIAILPNRHNLRYLETKRSKSGHLL